MSYKEKRVTLIGYGASNRALCSYLLSLGILPSIRNKEHISAPDTLRLITHDHLNVCESVAFRSPVVRPDKIKGACDISSEASLALSLARGYKIGVTGSDGKTTTSTLVCEMLRASKRTAFLCGNIGKPIIECAPKTRDSTYLVCELSSFQLMDMAPSLDCAIVTGISENHLDWHTDMQEYVRAKANILTRAKRAVLNYDDTAVRDLPVSSGAERTLVTRVGVVQRGSHIVKISDRSICYDGVRVLDRDKIRLRGEFNMTNIALALGAVYNIADLDAIREVAYTFSGVESRMRLIDTVGGVSIIDSSIDSTPARTSATLSAMDKERCVVILGGYDKNLSYEVLGDALRGVKYAVICGDNAEKIYTSVRGSCRAHITRGFECAVREAYFMCERGDTLLLSPASASFDMFENYRQRASEFARIVRGLKWKN